MLPEDDVGGNTVLTPVDEGDHSIGVHGLTSEELVVLEVGDDLLDVGGSTLLEDRDLLGVVLLEVSLDLLHVALDVRDVGLLVEGGLLETGVVDNVVDLDGVLALVGVVTTLGAGVGTNVDIGTLLDLDHGGIDLVDNVVDLLEVESAGEKLVTGENISVDQHVGLRMDGKRKSPVKNYFWVMEIFPLPPCVRPRGSPGCPYPQRSHAYIDGGKCSWGGRVNSHLYLVNRE